VQQVVAVPDLQDLAKAHPYDAGAVMQPRWITTVS
jgi:hypothetical protein